jgi:hypothetical protein
MSGTIDSWQAERDGITYRIDLYDDEEANADPAGQGDVYDGDPAALEAHARGDWQFAGVVVTPIIDGTEISGASDSLWSVEVGSYEGWKSDALPGGYIGREYLTDVHPVPDMIGEVRANLLKLSTDLQAHGLDR